MTKLIEELAAGSDLRVGRLTLDILGAIPVAPVKLRAWVERPGKRISLMMAEMSAARSGGADRPVARVTAWLLAPGDTAEVATDRYPPLVEGEAIPVPHSWVGAKGYLETVTWRRQPETGETGNVVWLSPLVPLVDSEPTTTLQRLAMVVDSRQRCGCGAGSRAVHVHEHRHRGAPAPAARRRGLRSCGRAARSVPTRSVSPPPSCSTGKGSSAPPHRRCWCNASRERRTVMAVRPHVGARGSAPVRRPRRRLILSRKREVPPVGGCAFVLDGAARRRRSLASRLGRHRT